MFNFFYNYHKAPFANDLYNRFDEEGNPPSPPNFSFLVDNAGDRLIDNAGYALVGNQ